MSLFSRRSRRPGRSFASTFAGADRWWKYDIFPANWIMKETSTVSESMPEEDSKGPLKVTSLDLNIVSNTESHHTDEYDITDADEATEASPQQLVVRRGDSFTFTINLDREFNKDIDDINLLFEIGNNPMVSKSTSVHIKSKWRIKVRHWSTIIQSQSGKSVVMEVLAPADCIIGKWRLTVETVYCAEGSTDKEILRYKHGQPVYILFNPWCKDDQVYIEDEILRDEYIMNQTGKIYSGNYKQIAAKPWNFGQFEDIVLDCSLFLLDHGGLSQTVRCNAVDVVRAVSAVVNSQDDSGVLVGNWSGSYEDGTAPTAWVGSEAILNQFYDTKEPVQYGQCWVFSGVATTVCRALGIPCRSVTNFASAHDCDGSITIDMHWDMKGEPIEEWNQDSVWNFHVWNEAWMARPDLEPGYGGWQVFDGTPQETSAGVYCAGPFSVKALQEGLVNIPHDGKFIFSEVNADKVHWITKEDGEMQQIIDKNSVGKCISTKSPRQAPAPRIDWRSAVNRAGDDPDREDITNMYKHKEGSEAERAAVYRASTWSTKPGVYNFGEQDVQFEVTQRDNILVGSPFDVVIRCQNKSRHVRTIHATVTLTAMYYTGVVKAKVKQHVFDMELKAIKADDCVMRVAAEEYLHLIVDQVSFKISAICKVAETNQVSAVDETFRLRRPDLVIEGPSQVKVGEEFTCKIKLTNSMPVHLTQCEWMVEGPGIQRPKRSKQNDLEPYDRADISMTFKARRAGKKQLLASFQSKELMDVTGVCNIQVIK